MKLKKIRNALLVVLTLALVSATTVAITWAATSAKFAPKENNFTNNPLIDLQFQELTFDNIPWGGERGSGPQEGVPEGSSWGEGVTPPTLPNGDPVDKPDDLGFNQAKHYVAGQYIPKNPELKNNSSTKMTSKTTGIGGTGYEVNGTSSDEWVALGVKYSLTIPNTALVVDTTKDNTNKDGSTPAKAYNVKAVSDAKTINFASYTQFANTIATVRTVNGSGNLDASGTTDGIRKPASTPEKGDDKWHDISSGNGTLYMYDTILTDGEDTETLFDCVKINDIGTGIGQIKQAWTTTDNGTTTVRYYVISDPTDSNKLYFVSALPEFKIELTGYAVQADNITTLAAAETALTNFYNSKNS